MLTLLIPELLWPEPSEKEAFQDLHCPALSQLLSGSAPTRQAACAYENALLNGLNTKQTGSSKLAEWRLLGEAKQPQPSQHPWLCCDPVHLRLHDNQLILADSAHIECSLAEAQTLASAINTHFSDQNAHPVFGQIHVATSQRWYIEIKDAQLAKALNNPPLSAVSGRRIEGLTGAGEEAKILRQWLTEVQMILHAHPLTEADRNAGKACINALWLWGNAEKISEKSSISTPFSSMTYALTCSLTGSLTSSSTSENQTPNALLQGLAKAHKLPFFSASHADDCWAKLPAGGRHLVVLEALLAPAHQENAAAYCQAINALESAWFAPLNKALKQGKIKRLTLSAPSVYGLLTWERRSLDAWKFWQRRQTLAALTQQIASK